MDARVIGKPGEQLGGTQKMMVTMLPAASEPVSSKQLSDRLMVIVLELVSSLVVNPVTVPCLRSFSPRESGAA
jgi:hypothetical protein